MNNGITTTPFVHVVTRMSEFGVMRVFEAFVVILTTKCPKKKKKKKKHDCITTEKEEITKQQPGVVHVCRQQRGMLHHL